jgi:hypothetical protein
MATGLGGLRNSSLIARGQLGGKKGPFCTLEGSPHNKSAIQIKGKDAAEISCMPALAARSGRAMEKGKETQRHPVIFLLRYRIVLTDGPPKADKEDKKFRFI